MKLLIRISLISLVIMVFSISTATGAAMLDLKRLLLFYPCDESGGDVLTDASGHGWDGDVANASWEKGVLGTQFA